MVVSTAAFREPRGVMRIIQFLFAICAFATTCNFSGEVQLTACTEKTVFTFQYGYPFQLDQLPSQKIVCKPPSSSEPPAPAESATVFMYGDFSSDAQFFVASGVLSFVYCIGIVVLYAMFEEKYQSNSMFPLADFVLTTVLAVLWLSSSAAFANALNGMKSVTEQSFLKSKYPLLTSTWASSFSSLNIAVLLGFLNFFLWASDLWFLYKETHWFKMRQESAGGV
jgi:hypothetical protein